MLKRYTKYILHHKIHFSVQIIKLFMLIVGCFKIITYIYHLGISFPPLLLGLSPALSLIVMLNIFLVLTISAIATRTTLHVLFCTLTASGSASCLALTSLSQEIYSSLNLLQIFRRIQNYLQAPLLSGPSML